MKYYFPVLILFLSFGASCEKYVDTPLERNDSLNHRPYCNDPRAVNYNWNFPGYSDSSVCIYPSEVFEGVYNFNDKIFAADGETLIDSAVLSFEFLKQDFEKLELVNFCTPNQTIRLTATRFSTASIDTLEPYGQIFCRPQDSVTGIFTVLNKDSVRLDLRVVSDSGINFHRGIAVQL